MGGLSLLLVVALTFGAARSGAIVNEAARDGCFQRAAAMLPRTVQHAERRLQRERPDARLASNIKPTRLLRDANIFPTLAAAAAPVAPLRAGLIDLPPPIRV